MTIASYQKAAAPQENLDLGNLDLGNLDLLAQPLTALVYETGFPIGAVLADLAARARAQGRRVGGLIELPAPPRADRHACDMVLQNLASGEEFAIAEERGKLARGCRLDYDVLLRAATSVQGQIENLDLILLNKFGKADAEGGGFRTLMAEALARDIPVAVGVPRRNLDAWREFAGDLAVEHDFGAA